MSTSRDFVITALVCCVLVLGVVAWRQHRELGRLERIARAQTAETGDAREETGRDIRETTAVWGDSRRRVIPVVVPRPLHARMAETGPAAGQPQLEGVMEMLEDPRFLQAVASHQRSMLDARFGELFGRLELTDDELESLRGLLIEKQNAAMDVLMVSKGELGGRIAGSEMKVATRRAQDEIDGLIEQTLGESRFAIFKAYEATLPQRAAVAQLQQRLSYTDEPLEVAQAEALVDMMVQGGGEVRPALPGVSVVVDPAERQAMPVMHGVAETVQITEEVINGAAKVLRPRQLVALNELKQEQEAAMLVVELARSRLPPATLDRLSILEGLDVQLLLQ